MEVPVLQFVDVSTLYDADVDEMAEDALVDECCRLYNRLNKANDALEKYGWKPYVV